MLKGVRVDAAFATAVGPDLVCVDSGCNKIILMAVPENQNGRTTYVESVAEDDPYLVTAAANGRLDIAGAGVFDNNEGVRHVYKHCPGASANLMPTLVISRAMAITQIGWDEDRRCEYMIIACKYFRDHKDIHCVSINGLFWITKTQMFDIIFRDGWTPEELAALTEKYSRNSLLSSPSSSANGFSVSIPSDNEAGNSDLESISDYCLHESE
jgi:hypothetical protein